MVKPVTRFNYLQVSLLRREVRRGPVLYTSVNFLHVCKKFMGLLVCMARSDVACLSKVIASLFMIACRQQCLISALNGAASDSKSKCLCSVSLILHLLRNEERDTHRKKERERATERDRERGNCWTGTRGGCGS